MLSSAQIAFFDREGYLVVENVFDPDRAIQPVVSEYEDLLDELIEGWIAEGKLASLPAGASFQEKLIHAYANGCDWFQPMDISLPTGEVAPDCPFHAGPAVFSLMTNAHLLDIVEQLVGPEITSVPIQHVRIKPPAPNLRASEVRAHITKTDWHQDRAVTLEEADETHMLTVWCAITDATPENGCLKVMPGSHKGEMKQHCPLPQVGIPAQFVDETKAVPLPVKSGGIVMFHPMTMHASLTNNTDGIRWSFDLRYARAGEPTGRPQFPDFLARSRANPASVLHDPQAWRQSWIDARARLSCQAAATTFYRWPADAPYCA